MQNPHQDDQNTINVARSPSISGPSTTSFPSRSTVFNTGNGSPMFNDVSVDAAAGGRNEGFGAGGAAGTAAPEPQPHNPTASESVSTSFVGVTTTRLPHLDGLGFRTC